MFELYTENARRVIFFARYEAAEHGSSYIFPEHVFLGLIRESRTSIAPLFGGEEQLERICARVDGAISRREKVPGHVDLPLDNSTKRVLAFAAEEAELAEEHWLDSGYLLLGLLREKPRVLQGIPEFANLNVDQIRASVAQTTPVGHSPVRDKRPVVFVRRTMFWPGFAVGALAATAVFLMIKGC
jgi:ATP-dependent Clp protease ATP-binding subunit ClpC